MIFCLICVRIFDHHFVVCSAERSQASVGESLRVRTHVLSGSQMSARVHVTTARTPARKTGASSNNYFIIAKRQV